MYPTIQSSGSAAPPRSSSYTLPNSHHQAAAGPPQYGAPQGNGPTLNSDSAQGSNFPLLRVHIADQFRTHPPVRVLRLCSQQSGSAGLLYRHSRFAPKLGTTCGQLAVSVACSCLRLRSCFLPKASSCYRCSGAGDDRAWAGRHREGTIFIRFRF